MKGSLRHLGALVGQSDTLWSSSAGAGTEDISRYLRRKLLCVYFTENTRNSSGRQQKRLWSAIV